MAAPSLSAPSASRSRFNAKHALFLVFGLLAAVVIYDRELSLLDGKSFLRQRYAPVPWLIMLHGIPGATALLLGIFQFSNRLRARYLNVHRILGRIYVGSVFIAAPLAVIVGFSLPGDGVLHAADTIQASGWIFTTAVALYCVKTGNIQQHRLWMMRSYPYAMVFILVRATLAIPPLKAGGELTVDVVVWTWIALCGFVPSAYIALQQTLAQCRVTTARATAKAAD